MHPEAPVQVEARNGKVVADGELPAGHARNAEPDIDWEIERIPTFCVVDFEVDVPGPAPYRLRLSRGRPLDFTVPAAGGKPIEVVLG